MRTGSQLAHEDGEQSGTDAGDGTQVHAVIPPGFLEDIDRPIVCRIADRVALAVKYEPSSLDLAPQKVAVDAMQRLNFGVRRAGSARMIDDDLEPAGLQGVED